MCKRTKHKYHSTQAQKSEAHYQTNEGPDKGENKAKPKPNHRIFTEHRHARRQEAQRSMLTKDGLIRSPSGLAHLAPTLVG